MNAQTKTVNHTGEYYLSGVPETACGFKLDDNGTFQFFFSQGALDRFGTGQWTVQGQQIVLNSNPSPAHHFKLVESRKEPGDKLMIRVTDSNEIVLRYVYAIVNGGGEAENEGMLDEQGLISLPGQAVDSIELLFQFCPEKSSVFHISQKSHNYFEFRFEPWMMEVFFKDFRLTIGKEGLTGASPILQGDAFLYRKQR